MSMIFQSLLLITLEMISCNLFFESFGEKRYQGKKYQNGLILLFLIIIVMCIVFYLQNHLIWKEIGIIGITSVMMILIWNISIIRSLILSFLYFALVILVDYITILFAMACYSSVTEIEKNYILEGDLLAVLGKAVMFLFVLLIRRFIGNKKKILLSDREWLRFIIFPLFSIFTIIAMIDAIGGLKNQRAEQVCFVIAAGLTGMNIMVYYLINGILQQELRNRENELFQVQSKNQMRLYHSISDNYNKQMKKTHEYKNQLLCIYSLMADQKYSELKNYVSSLTGNLNKEMDAINTNHVLINAILNTKYQEAVEKNILFVIKINDLSKIRICDEDIVVILSNLLNNAIEACEKCCDKVIKLKFVRENGEIILSVKNTYEGDLLFHNGKLITTKETEKEEHGIGIGNIIDVIKKYGGVYTVQGDGGEFSFSVVLPE